MKLFAKTLSVLVASAAIAGIFSAQAEDNAAANTAPVGQTCLQGQPCASAAAASSGGAAKTGEQVFNTTCTSCHSTGAAGAPKVGDAAAWGPRFAAKGKEGLYKSAENGFNGMPAKGLCFACSDDELKGAVDYMLSKIGK
ncbi:MAG TPA: c-type cytochrome [Pseudomonadales bacterium]|nr:c-type cytochrome [Pseudomonadales bacterium]